MYIPKIGWQAFLLLGDEPKLAGKPCCYLHMSQTFKELSTYAVKVKSKFGEMGLMTIILVQLQHFLLGISSAI